jgi:hypothetical protein
MGCAQSCIPNGASLCVPNSSKGTTIAHIKKDMAILLVIFNPSMSKRIIMNYLYTVEQFYLQGLPTYTLELVYEGRKPELAANVPNVFHVKTNSYMFHKENMIRVLEKKIPQKYQKLLFVDADIVWKQSSWYSQISRTLDYYEVVQPFEQGHWLDLTYKKKEISRETVLFMWKDKWDHTLHPGFAWAMRRDWYIKNGFFDYALSGSGDTLSAAHWLNKKFPKGFKSLPTALTAVYAEFCKKPRPQIGYCKGLEVFHLYHGGRANRQYVDRHKMLDVEQDIMLLTHINADGIIEWKDPEYWNPQFLKYFKSRDDDDLSEETKAKPVIKISLSS